MEHAEDAAAMRAYACHADFYRNSAYARFEQRHRAGGSFGVSMIDAEQPAFDLVDAAVPEFVFGCNRTDDVDAIVDIGDGDRYGRSIPGGSFIVVPPMTETRTRALVAHRITMACIPSAEVFGLLDRAELDGHPFSDFYGRMRPHPRGTRLLDEMWHASERIGPVANLWLDGLTLQFLSVLADARALSPVGESAREDVRIRRALDYIEGHLGEPLTVAELATVATLSPSHFARAFKVTVGETVWHHVQVRRCERARVLLTTTRLPIAEIARVCGFASQPHLNQVVRRRFGATPGQIRRSGPDRRGLALP